jgi:DNA modification methylase
MVAVFREVRRVLREDGVLWLNLGDSYATGGMSNPSEKSTLGGGKDRGAAGYFINCLRPEFLKPKDLVGIPWRVAFALQADGWWLRQDIIWHKPNPMPESVTDRCTKAHEYIFLLTKSARYFYDSEAVKEASGKAAGVVTLVSSEGKEGTLRNNEGRIHVSDGTRNRRSVWTVSTKPYSGAHFATYPPDLIEPCILAGTSERGRCKACGAAWERVVETVTVPRREKPIGYDYGGVHNNPTSNMRRPNGHEVAAHKAANPDKTIGWKPACQCNAGEPIPCLVLDPFNGSGTTGEVCIKHGRHYVGCELNQDYIELAKQRLGKAEQRYGLPLLETA